MSNASNKSNEKSTILTYAPLFSPAVAIFALGWAYFINTQQVQLQSQQAYFAEVQAKLALEQANIKKTQDVHDQALHGISIHPVRYSIELKIDESGKLLPGQSFEITNGSERIATEISAFWEIIGTDYGNPKGWGKTEEIELDQQTLRPLEQMTLNALPSQLSIIAAPDNESKAIDYYGHLRIVFGAGLSGKSLIVIGFRNDGQSQ